jgi:putative FmdB family regulatory protein
MPTYNYLCDLCGHNYSETREVSQTQFIVKCNACNDGNYEEAN